MIEIANVIVLVAERVAILAPHDLDVSIDERLVVDRVVAQELGVAAETVVLEEDERGGERVEAVAAVLDREVSGGARRLAHVVVRLARDRRAGEIARDRADVQRVLGDAEVVGELFDVLAVEQPFAPRTRVACCHACHVYRVAHVRDQRGRLYANSRCSLITFFCFCFLFNNSF